MLGNDLKAQFGDQIIDLDIQTRIRRAAFDERLGALKQCLMEENGSRAAAAIT
jgi:hypothetical protein